MGVFEQMEAVERLLRRPDDLAGWCAQAAEDDAAVLRTVDPVRLRAVARTQADLVLARWWQPRFPATLALLGADEPALELVGSPHFEAAEGEDDLGTALVNAVLDGLAAGRLDAPAWLPELLAYEYLLSVGLPRRAAGEPVAGPTERRLFGDAVVWLEGGRLAAPVAACTFVAPVSAIREGADPEAEDAPEALLLVLDPEGASEVAAPHEAIDALELLAAGADDAALDEALGAEAAAELRAWLGDLGVLGA